MAFLLGIETSSSRCSVALGDGESIEELAEDRPREHHAIILPMVAELLRRADAKLHELDAIAFGRGPGSFTGLRIAASITQGLAFGAGLRVVAVSSLQALAAQAGERSGCSACEVLVAVDAHLGEIYWGHYVWTPGALQVLHDDGLSHTGEFRAAARGLVGTMILTGDAWSKYPQIPLPDATPVVAAAPAAREVVRLAARIERSRWVDAFHAEPVYVRSASLWKKRTEQGGSSGPG